MALAVICISWLPLKPLANAQSKKKRQNGRGKLSHVPHLHGLGFSRITWLPFSPMPNEPHGKETRQSRILQPQLKLAPHLPVAPLASAQRKTTVPQHKSTVLQPRLGPHMHGLGLLTHLLAATCAAGQCTQHCNRAQQAKNKAERHTSMALAFCRISWLPFPPIPTARRQRKARQSYNKKTAAPPWP